MQKYAAHPGLLALAAAVALSGPNSHKTVLDRDYAKPWVAAIIALALVLIVIKVGSQAHPEFIYFQF